MEKVSVIIPTFNRVSMVCDCIDSVLQSTYKNMEILIVDNGSTDNTREIVSDKYSNVSEVSVIRLEQNLMAAGGRNAGIKVATGKYLLFIDSDNIIDSHMIEILVKEMKSDDKIGLVAPLAVNYHSGNDIWMVSGDYNFFTTRPIALLAHKRLEEVKLEKRYKTYYSPNIMMASRQAIEAVGGFDVLYYMGYEEADFGYRIRNAGFEGYIVTDARTRHLGYVSDGELKKLRLLGIETPERAFHFAKNRTVFMKKYAKWYHLLTYYVFFLHVYTVYYTIITLQCRRKDITKAWIKGTIRGIFIKTNHNIKVQI
ncbi:MAG: glycosyltransferase family 2 protein [Lachnospiraceae bacterium]|jgi:GT2 family glycosyltransferase